MAYYIVDVFYLLTVSVSYVLKVIWNMAKSIETSWQENLASFDYLQYEITDLINDCFSSTCYQKTN